MNLSALRENSGDAVRQLLRDFDSSAGAMELIQQVDALCLHLRTIAAATLLVDGNPQGFFLNLCRAAENWRRLLVHLHRHGLPLPASRHNLPLLGTVAAGHWELARRVAESSEPRWLPQEEYRSEYLAAQLLHALILEQHDTATRLVGELESSEEEASLGRAALARALLQADALGFIQAFERAVLLRSEQVEKQARLFTTPVTRFAPERFLWLEGLALLRLAERAGLPTHEAYHLYCPPLARVPRTVPYRGDWVIPLSPTPPSP
jgi:hypothetical protein